MTTSFSASLIALNEAIATSRIAVSGSRVVRDCNRWGMPLLVMIYPRGKGVDPIAPATVGHCVRVAEELGADLIKTNYTGDPASWKRIVSACSVPVVIAGGEKAGDLETLQAIRDSVVPGYRDWLDFMQQEYLPAAREEMTWENYLFKVEEVKGHQIRRVRLTILPSPAPADVCPAGTD